MRASTVPTRQNAVRRQRTNLAIPIGCLLVALAALLSGSLLEATILPTGTIVGTSRRAGALMLCRILLALAGLYFVIRRPRVTAIHLAALVPGLVMAFVIGAVVLQVTYHPPRIVCGWKSLTPKAEQNQIGYRGRPIAYGPDDYVIVLLGDSQVEAAKLAMTAMPEQRLEAHLGELGKKVKVFSLGTGGYGQDQELLALEEYFQKYRADMVVLWQTQENDIWNNVYKTHMFNMNPKPTYRLDAAGKLAGPSEGLGQPLADSKIVMVSLWERAFGLPWRDKSWERQLPPAYVPMDHYDGPVREDWQERWKTNLGRMRDENLKTEKSHLAVFLTPRSPRMQYGVDLTRALTMAIRDEAAAHGAGLAIFQGDEPMTVAEEKQVYVLNGKYYGVSKRQMEADWADVNRGMEFETIPVTVPDWRVATDDGHLNTPATDQVMGELAKRLQSRIVEKTPQAGAK